ncbi:MAG: hypothetical protein WDZ37_07480 [Solirubrobacterales bacterium]
MASSPLGEDSHLYLKLLEITQTSGQVEARAWFFSEFSAQSYAELIDRYPKGSRESDMLMNVLVFYESAAVLVSRGLLHEDVFFDAPFGFDVVWERVGDVLVEWREQSDPATWENLVWLGKRYKAWSRYVWKSKLESVPPDRAVRRRGG